MPLQEAYLDKPISQGRAFVIKAYDVKLTREAFEDLDENAREKVTAAPHRGDFYEAENIPSAGSPDYRDFLWETLSDEARDDGQIKSFFIVMRETSSESPEPQDVSADWPGAGIFIEGL